MTIKMNLQQKKCSRCGAIATKWHKSLVREIEISVPFCDRCWEYKELGAMSDKTRVWIAEYQAGNRWNIAGVFSSEKNASDFLQKHYRMFSTRAIHCFKLDPELPGEER